MTAPQLKQAMTIGSRDPLLPRDTADLVRGHWAVENSLHWVLDDTFQEDRCRLRTGQAARNMAALRRVALNILTLLKQYFWPKLSIRRLPGWWPEIPPGWSRSWPCDDFVNALVRTACLAGLRIQ